MATPARFLLPVLFSLVALVAPVRAQDAAAADPAALEELVGRIALYPDDLLSITLPAATFPLQVVEADRWIAANKGKKDAKPKDTWDASVKALINYPDVVSMMSKDLDWTTAVGEAVVADQNAVMDAVQAFRRKADGAGNLKSDEKMTVDKEEQVIKIVQSDPEIIYVPQYEPTTVVVQQAAPVYPTYYPTAYPCYYCSYPPGHAFASGFFWGAATAYAFNWFGGGIHNDIDIDINSNRNVNRNTNRSSSRERATNIDRGKSNQMRQNGQGGWKSNQSRGDVARGGRTNSATAGNRMGDRGGATASNRAGTGAGNRGGAGASATNRGGAGASTANRGGGASASNRAAGGGARSTSSYGGGNRASAGGGGGNYGNASRYSGSARSSAPSRSAYGGGGGGGSRSASAYSSRGASSRSSMGGGGGRSMGGGGRGGGGGGRRR